MLADINATGAVVADVPGSWHQTFPWVTQFCGAETLSGTRTLSNTPVVIPFGLLSVAKVMVIKGGDGATVNATFTTPAGTVTVRVTEVLYIQSSAGVTDLSLSGSGVAQYLLAGN